MCSSSVQFSKYHGLGNDFILIDNRASPKPTITSDRAVQLCDRNFGIGGDGVIFALPPNSNSTDYSMRIFNSDGSEPEMCGNGIRCLARFIADLDGAKEAKHKVDTLAGLIQPELLEDGQVCVDMGQPILNPEDIPTTLTSNSDSGAAVAQPLEVDGAVWTVTTVSMGNPHAVVFGKDGGPVKVDDIDLPHTGPLFEDNGVFPARVNTEFVEVLSPDHVKMCVWERGAGATLACGTGACAIAVAGVLEGRTNPKCRVDLPGGPLLIEWDKDGDGHVYMTGPAELAFSGQFLL